MIINKTIKTKIKCDIVQSVITSWAISPFGEPDTWKSNALINLHAGGIVIWRIIVVSMWGREINVPRCDAVHEANSDGR